MKRKILALTMVLALVGALVAPMAVSAANSGTQNASTSSATSISIKGQDYTTDVSTITFSAGAPSAVVSDPSNGTTAQILGAAGTAKPVVTLVNSAAAAYNVWYTITTFTNGVAASEKYLINAKGAACANVAAIANTVTFDSNTISAGPSLIAATADGDTSKLDLYLSLTLSALAGKSGSSTITILGETP